jgi:hypothetical protein
MRSNKNACVREKAADAIQTAYGLFRPLLGPRACRFHPTCSEYSFKSLKIHGLFEGAFLSAARIFRCHPWNPGGYDPVPLTRKFRFKSFFTGKPLDKNSTEFLGPNIRETN